MVLVVFLIVFILGFLLFFRNRLPGKDGDYTRLKRRNYMVLVLILIFLFALNIFRVYSRGGTAKDVISTHPAVIVTGVLAIVLLIIGRRKKKK